MRIIFILFQLLALIPHVFADCKNFTASIRAQGDTSFTTTFNSFRISAIIDCTQGGSNRGVPSNSSLTLNCNQTTCGIASPDNFKVLLNRTMNVTTSSAASDSLFKLTQNAFQLLDRVNFNQSYAYGFGGYGTCIPQGQAGYASFTPIYRCTEGVLSECSGDGYPSDGTAVQLCAVSTLGISGTQANGVLGLVRTSGGDEAPVPANATAPTVPSSGAADVSLNQWLTFPAVAIALWTVFV